MRSIITAVILVSCMMMLGMSPANAQQGPYCVSLTGFCDRLEVYVDQNRNVYGVWDWLCDGVTLAPVLGYFDTPVSVGTRPVDSLGAPFYYTCNFLFDRSNNTFDLWGYDGSAVYQFQNNAGWTIVPGPCDWKGGCSDCDQEASLFEVYLGR